STSAWSQLYSEAGCGDAHGPGIPFRRFNLVFGISTALDNECAFAPGVQINERYNGLRIRQLRNQRRHVFRKSRSLVNRIEVPQPRIQQSTFASRFQSAERELK